MTTLADMFPVADFDRMAHLGYIRIQKHPRLIDYEIANYTEKAVYDKEWNDVTLQCRGLIYNALTGEVIARPFRKFFNHNESTAPKIGLKDPVVVTDKLDGCFPRGTALNLWGGGTITIDQVVRQRLAVTLVGMNDDGDMVPAVVTDWHDNGRKDHWLDIEVDAPVSRRSGAGGHPNKLRVTVNHHLHVNGKYRPACDVRPGDSMIAQGWQPSGSVLKLIRASLLGDGCLTWGGNAGSARFQEGHSEKQADYVMAMRKSMGDCGVNRSDTVSGYGSRMVWVGSREYPILGDMRREWYPDGVKTVPADLSWIDDFAVAKWLMDDGYRSHSDLQQDRIVFSTNSFAWNDVRRLADRLTEMYGVSCTVFEDRGPNIRVNAGQDRSIDQLWAGVARHVHPSLRYKLPERWREVPYEELPIGFEETYGREVRVLSVNPVEASARNFPSGRTGYDITTSTHNYMARGVLVHNSLGILYPEADGWAVATRGSFDSPQARHATDVWQRYYEREWEPIAGLTYLFEIIYPENRIVVDYNRLDDIVLLGAVDIATGKTIAPEVIQHSNRPWPGPVTETFTFSTYSEALAAAPRPGKEGFVVHNLRTDERVKIKYSEYVTLHRLVTGLTARRVHEAMLDGVDMDTFIAPLPDEFHDWVRQVAGRIEDRVRDEKAAVEHQWLQVIAACEEQSPEATDPGFPEDAASAARHEGTPRLGTGGWPTSVSMGLETGRALSREQRKLFATIAKDYPYAWALFAKLDGRDYERKLLESADPGVETPQGRTFSEATA